MKSKYWIMFFSVLLVCCLALSIPVLMPGEEAKFAQITSDGQMIMTLSLSIDQDITIPSPVGGSNTVTVKGGKIGVTEASCPDHYCMKRGMCSGGSQIVCLPNRLIIRFLEDQSVDSVVG